MASFPMFRPCHKRSVAGRVWMNGGAMAPDGKGDGRRRDARNEFLRVCVSKMRTCGHRVAETDGEHVTACPC